MPLCADSAADPLPAIAALARDGMNRAHGQNWRLFRNICDLAERRTTPDPKTKE